MESSLQSRGWFYRNLANIVTVARLLMASWLVCLIIWAPEQAVLMCALVIVCALSDVLDGYLARRMRIVSKVGGSLDRLADKIFICSLIIFMAWGHSPGDSAPGWLKTLSRGIVGVIILFECFLMVSGTWGTFQGKNITSNQFARIKMVLQSIAVTFWFICLAVVRQGIGMFWPLIIVVADILLIFSAFYAVKSLKIYAEEFFGGN